MLSQMVDPLAQESSHVLVLEGNPVEGCAYVVLHQEGLVVGQQP